MRGIAPADFSDAIKSCARRVERLGVGSLEKEYSPRAFSEIDFICAIAWESRDFSLPAAARPSKSRAVLYGEGLKMTAISLHKSAAGVPNWSLFWRDYWRHEARPGGAYDARPSWARPGDARLARDQNTGKLGGAYCRATDQYLRESGLDPKDVETVMEVLGRYQDDGEDQDPTIAIGGTRGQVGRGQVEPGGSQDAMRQAADAAAQALLRSSRSLAADAKMTQRDREGRGFAGRFPDAAKIKVIG